MSSHGFFIPTRFVWRFGGRQVHLCGSFTRWVETVPMAPVDSSQTGVFAVVVHLPPGYHQYKFIVDGKWRHDETAPFMPDPLGNVNNWLFVRRVDPTPSQAAVGGSASQFEAVAQMAAQQQAMLMQQQAAAAAAAAMQQQQQQQQQVSTPRLDHGAASAASLAAQQQLTSPLPSSASQDVDMSNAEAAAVIAPIVIHNPKEPEYTRKKVATDLSVFLHLSQALFLTAFPNIFQVSDFLHGHTAYELIPESGKVVVIDVDLPVRQAFHALHEQVGGIRRRERKEREGRSCSLLC